MLLVSFPAAAVDISSNDTFNGQGLCLSDQHGPAYQEFAVIAAFVREVFDLSGNDGIGKEILEVIEPFDAHLIEVKTFVGYQVRQVSIKS